MDIHDAELALVEARRVKAPSGRVILSIVHPIADLMVEAKDLDASDVNYCTNRVFDAVDHDDGMRMHFFG